MPATEPAQSEQTDAASEAKGQGAAGDEPNDEHLERLRAEKAALESMLQSKKAGNDTKPEAKLAEENESSTPAEQPLSGKDGAKEPATAAVPPPPRASRGAWRGAES